MYDLVPKFYYDSASYRLECRYLLLGCIPSKNKYNVITQEEKQERYRRNYYAIKFMLYFDCFPEIQDYLGMNTRKSTRPDIEYCDYDEYLTALIADINAQTKVNCPQVYHDYFRNLRKKLNRVSKRIESYINWVNEDYHLYFCTITLKDYYRSDTLTAEKYDEIRKQLRKHISSFSTHYLFNKDFGLKDTRRLHFHGIMLLKDSLLPCLYRNTRKLFAPICDFKLINSHSDYIARYINKLSYHALKVNYGKFKEHLIYSRFQLPKFKLLRYGAISGFSNDFSPVGKLLIKGTSVPYRLAHISKLVRF